ncbi:hypothetical protein Osc7112_6219 [Oscillatoria nigro-viridis PCC 7112]|uniref:Uncharacterized protein n=1 Tax=Phormidium nigroviride PCC 7112 TaxID=179408 RepID=K9VQN3_9CYAN|nr:hypothetical protein [Oscillatoria nigro-viridis]AFZ10398.1 hypothetical protein Osc7112_6219 [Oscillatoria nigro-viridis PCC 7112]
MGEAKRRKKLNPNYEKLTSQNDPIGIEENYECYGERAEYFKNLDFYLNQGGAFEESLPRYHRYRSVTESQLFQFIQNAIDREEQTATYILNKVKSLSDLTEIQSDLLGLVDKSIMSKRSGDLNQAFKYYDQVFSHNQTWFMLWYGLAKLLCLFREYRMAFACIKICTYLYPKMWNGRQYHSDPDLSYHYDQIYSLAIAGEENEPYLRTLGRPLNTVRIVNSNGKVIANSPVGKIKVVKPESLSSDIKTQVKGDSHNMVRIKVVDVGRSGNPEYAEYTQAQIKEFRSTIVTVLTRNLMPTSDDFVETVLGASLACHYWRKDLSFVGAVEQVVQDIERTMGRGY